MEIGNNRTIYGSDDVAVFLSILKKKRTFDSGSLITQDYNTWFVITNQMRSNFIAVYK